MSIYKAKKNFGYIVKIAEKTENVISAELYFLLLYYIILHFRTLCNAYSVNRYRTELFQTDGMYLFL